MVREVEGGIEIHLRYSNHFVFTSSSKEVAVEEIAPALVFCNVKTGVMTRSSLCNPCIWKP